MFFPDSFWSPEKSPEDIFWNVPNWKSRKFFQWYWAYVVISRHSYILICISKCNTYIRIYKSSGYEKSENFPITKFRNFFREKTRLCGMGLVDFSTYIRAPPAPTQSPIHPRCASQSLSVLVTYISSSMWSGIRYTFF